MAAKARRMPGLHLAARHQRRQHQHREEGAEERGLHALDLLGQQPDHHAVQGEDESAADQPQRALHVGRQAAELGDGEAH
jgi:hypothetical protein